MGLFGDAAARFLRTSWKSVQDLAEELNAVFNSSGIDMSPRSITINQPAGATIPPLVINQPANTTTPAIVVNNGGTTINLGGTGGGGGGGGAGVDLGDIEFPGQDPDDAEDATPDPILNPIPLHGQVIGKVGGRVYSLRCWAKRPDLYPPIGILPVEFPDIDPDDVIPNGTSCSVTMFPKIVFNVIQPDKSIGYASIFLAAE